MAGRPRLHIKASQEQVRRLEDLLAQFDTTEPSIKGHHDVLYRQIRAALAHAPAQDEVITNTLANYAFEHLEIAFCTSLLVQAGQSSAIMP